MAKRQIAPDDNQEQGQEGQAVQTPITTTAHVDILRAELTGEVGTQITQRLIRVGSFVTGLIFAAVFGGIITALWVINGQVNELSGKYSSPDKVIEHIGKRVENLEKENQELSTKIHQQEMQELKEQIEELKLKKQINNGH